MICYELIRLKFAYLLEKPNFFQMKRREGERVEELDKVRNIEGIEGIERYRNF